MFKDFISVLMLFSCSIRPSSEDGRDLSSLMSMVDISVTLVFHKFRGCLYLYVTLNVIERLSSASFNPPNCPQSKK